MTKKDAQTDTLEQEKGYAVPLFEERKAIKNDDDVLGGMKSLETRYHDQNMVLKVANGLCHDIFFRAQDVYAPGFEEIPDFWEEVPEEERQIKTPEGQKESQKPLDSRHRNRTYRLDTEIEEEPPKRRRKPRPKRGSGRKRSERGGKTRRRRSRPPKKRS